MPTGNLANVFVAGALALMGFGAAMLPAAADTVAVTVSGTGVSACNGNAGTGTTCSENQHSSQTLGWEFTATSALTVTQLGLWDAGSTSNLGAYNITVDLESTTGTVLASAVVNSSSTQSGVSGATDFAFTALGTPYTLTATDTYFIVAAYPCSGSGCNIPLIYPNNSSSLTTATAESGITYNNGASCSTASCTPAAVTSDADGTVSTSNAIYFGPDFETGIAALPLPGALPLFAMGLGVMGMFGWRRKPKSRRIVAV
jgi:hypothetical protein